MIIYLKLKQGRKKRLIATGLLAQLVYSITSTTWGSRVRVRHNPRYFVQHFFLHPRFPVLITLVPGKYQPQACAQDQQDPPETSLAQAFLLP